MKLCLQCNQYFEEKIEFCPTDSLMLESVGKDPLIGALINDRYVVESVIGKGSSGIVYKARRLLMGREVAVKVLHSYLGADTSSLDRFLREARAASRLRHPHIITLWESGVTDDGQPYFVMDYLEGMTLADLIREKGAIHLIRALPIIRQVCEALTEAHKLGIVHRDIKPENIVLQETDYADDYVKVLDFSIADLPHELSGSSKLPKGKTAAGSPAYMSAEQCQGLELDARSDIYSLAVVIFELLTGKRPFSAESLRDLMLMHVAEQAPLLSAIRPDLRFPLQLETVLSKALAKSPDERQQSIKEFWKELEEAAGGFDSLNLIVKPKKDSVQAEDFSVPVSDRLIDSSIVEADKGAILDRFGPVPDPDLIADQDNKAEKPNYDASYAVKRLLKAAKRSSNTDNGDDLPDPAQSRNDECNGSLETSSISSHPTGIETPIPVLNIEPKPEKTSTTTQPEIIVDERLSSSKEATDSRVKPNREPQPVSGGQAPPQVGGLSKRSSTDVATDNKQLIATVQSAAETTKQTTLASSGPGRAQGLGMQAVKNAISNKENAPSSSLPETANRLIEAAQRRSKVDLNQSVDSAIDLADTNNLLQQPVQQPDVSVQKRNAIEPGTKVEERISQNMSRFFEAVQKGAEESIWPLHPKTRDTSKPAKSVGSVKPGEKTKGQTVKYKPNEQRTGPDLPSTDQARQEALSEAIKRLTDPGSPNIKTALEREAVMRAHNVLSQGHNQATLPTSKLSEVTNDYFSGYRMPDPRNLGEKTQLQRESRQAVRALFQVSRIKPISVIVPFLVIATISGLTYWTMFETMPRQAAPSPDILIKEGRIEEALAVFEHEQKIGKLKPGDLEKVGTLYLTLAKKYSQQNKYYEALTFVERLPNKLRTAEIETLAKRWKKLAKKPVEMQ